MVLLATPSTVEPAGLWVAADNLQERDYQAGPSGIGGGHTGYILGVHPGLEKDGLEDDKVLVEVDQQHDGEAQTSDLRSVHVADAGWSALAEAFAPLQELVQAVARNEARSLQAPVEEGPLDCSYPVLFHRD